MKKYDCVFESFNAGDSKVGLVPVNIFPAKLTTGPNSIDNPYLAISSFKIILNSANELSDHIADISGS